MYVMYQVDADNADTGTVVAVSNDADSAESWPDGVWVESIPEPANSAGRVARLKIDLKTKELYYIYVDGAGNSTNDYLTRIKSLEDRLDRLTKAVDDLIMGGLM